MDKNIKDTITKANTYIVDGKVKKAILLLKDALGNQPEQYNELMQMISQWNGAEKDALLQMTTREQMQVTHARITQALLVFIQNIKQQSSTNSSPTSIPIPPTHEGKRQILFLYAQEDQAWLDKLKKHLFLLMRQENLVFIDLHADTPIGIQYETSYHQELIKIADKVLCLVSPNCFTFEIYPLAEMAIKAGKLIPLNIDVISSQENIFSPLKGLPSNQQFVSQWENENQALADIAGALGRFFKL